MAVELLWPSSQMTDTKPRLVDVQSHTAYWLQFAFLSLCMQPASILTMALHSKVTPLRWLVSVAPC